MFLFWFFFFKVVINGGATSSGDQDTEDTELMAIYTTENGIAEKVRGGFLPGEKSFLPFQLWFCLAARFSVSNWTCWLADSDGAWGSSVLMTLLVTRFGCRTWGMTQQMLETINALWPGTKIPNAQFFDFFVSAGLSPGFPDRVILLCSPALNNFCN